MEFTGNKVKLCPRCKVVPLHPEEIKNALSRRDNKTYICSPCGTAEAMFDFARSQKNISKNEIYMEKVWLDEVEK